ncbi:MAG: response regulator [Planctomycetota bacterium]|jgi:CheY-like chemotaxis protein
MLNGITILMAEDDAGHARLMRRNFLRAGIQNEILHFEDGQAVMDFLQDPEDAERLIHPYMLLLDIRMPKLDGIEVLQRVKQDESLQSIPVVMISTTKDPDTVRRCYELGCANYIVKPTSIGQFARVITELGKTLQAVCR